MTLSSGQRISADLLVWTISPAILYRLAGAELPRGLSRPQFLRTTLYHYVFDRPFLTKLYYFNNFDPSYTTFRVTLYPNILEEHHAKDGFHCTVEVVGPNSESDPPSSALVHQELVKMGCVHAEAHTVWAGSEPLAQGFPIPTIEFSNTSKSILEAAKERWSDEDDRNRRTHTYDR